jgi:Arc/MetJ-type ribon-helix-helix transcriptional regulator
MRAGIAACKLDPGKKFTTVSIPSPLFEKVSQRIKGTGFPSVSSYVTFVLRELVAKEQEQRQANPFSKEDEQRVRDRLKALGYL